MPVEHHNHQTYRVVQLKVRFAGFINYTYLVIDEQTKQTMIVDPAWELSQITTVLEKLEVIPSTIWLTHSHFDHVNLVDSLVKKYNSQVFMSGDEINFYNYQCRNLNPFGHRDQFMLGQTAIVCLLTPGHTVGSACYLLGDSLFTGDTIFTEGCGICDTYGGSPERMFQSIQEIKASVSLDTKIYPGHSFGQKPGQSLKCLLKENIYFQFNSVEHFIAFRMRNNQTGLFSFK